MKAVIRGAGYILAHTPDMVLHNGTTQTTERIVNPNSEYLKRLPNHLRSFEEVCAYWPNQVYIGNKTPQDLEALPQDPARGLVDLKCDVSDRYGKFGQIMPQPEFILMMQACDVFDLLKLESGFVAEYKPQLAQNPFIDESILANIPETQTDAAEIKRLVEEEHSEGLYHNNVLVGCVKRAHDIDINLSAHVMHENLVSKASSVISMLAAIEASGVNKDEVEYVIDCCEEACGDMNQRGGGNFAKAAAEIVGLKNATGSDTRSFCAAPAHAIVNAAALVASGTYNCVMVTAGGSTAKLGMNGKNHIDKGLPALEDCVAGFATVISADDGKNPYINL
ncbi:MAG TPA: glycine/sarcosine/betaine reductase complex component C subunit beta, partial [Bacillota bacterium]|nr:glycine/sarcosine/betaine reductase complex component C subunit beta [Bacillota bacterium]